MGSKYKIGKAFYPTIKESIRDLGKRYRKETGKKRSTIFDDEYAKIIRDRADRMMEGDRYVKKSLNGSTKKYNELMKVRDKFSAGGTMIKKKKKTKDPLVSKYKRIRNTILTAPEAVSIGEAVTDLIGMGGFDDGALVSKKPKKLRPVKPKKLESVKPSEKQIPESNKGLKPIPPENKGLKKLPRGVRNKMGYMQGGGSVVVPVKIGKNKPTKIM